MCEGLKSAAYGHIYLKAAANESGRPGRHGGMQMYKAAIITLSDKGARGEREDVSGQVIRELLTEGGYEIAEQLLLSDDREGLTRELVRIADTGAADLVVTTGGTGFSVRDNAPEATMDAIERNAPGIAEAMRMQSLSITPRGMLSRGVSGIRKRTLIVNLPGSPKAVRENLSFILSSLDHGIAILKGDAGECAQVPNA